MTGLIANPNIAPFIRESVLAYQEAEMLGCFYTTVYHHQEHLFTSLLTKISGKFRQELNRRPLHEIDYSLIKGLWLPELCRITATKLINPIVADRVWEWAEHNFDSWTSKQLKISTAFVHVYEHAALQTLQEANKKRIVSIYEQPSQYHHSFTAIVEEQLKLYPELKNAEVSLLNDSNAVRRNKRRDEELAIADFILCNSAFTEKTLLEAGILPQKIMKIHYGFPEIADFKTASPASAKLRFIYAGNLSLRKGIHILLQAWKELHLGDSAELFLIGKNQLPDFFWQGLPDNIKKFENLPQTEYFKLLLASNIFVLPTLADGFGMVISEAMAKGIPVLTTTASAGPDLIKHQNNGLLVSPNDKEALKGQLKWCMDNRNTLADIGKKALATAKAYPWKAYRKKLAGMVKEMIESHPNTTHSTKSTASQIHHNVR
jgi:glycosyltransferase involved in cell wall biosynthesis